MHLTAGELRAYLDHELNGPDRDRVRDHLAGCAQCQGQAEALRLRALQVNERLAALTPHTHQAPLSLGAARQRLKARSLEKENTAVLKKIFSRRYRTAWAAATVVALLAVALAFPPVQAIANSFLGLFRVQQFTVVQVNPSELPELGSSSQFEAMLSKDVQYEEGGEAYQVANAAEASSQAGFPVRLPTAITEPEVLRIQPGGKASLSVDLPRVQALLAEIGRADIQLPESLDGAIVNVEVPTSVVAQYGRCKFNSEALREAGYDPDDQRLPSLPDCTTLVQMPSPSISAPIGLDVAQIGEAFLQVMGMNPEEAAHFAQNVDWATTLVVPIPRYGTTYRDVAVDGVTGTLIEQDMPDHPRQYVLMWAKDGYVYALSGPGTATTALRIASSLQ